MERGIAVKLGFVWYTDFDNFHLKVFDFRKLRIVGEYKKKIYLPRELKYSPRYVKYRGVKNILKYGEMVRKFILGKNEIISENELVKSLNIDPRMVKVILEKFAAEGFLGCTTGYKKRFWRKF